MEETLWGSSESKADRHVATLNKVEAHYRQGSPSRIAEIARIRRLFWEFIGTLGDGETFQAVDFTNWLVARNAMPDESVCDARCIGGIIIGARKRHRIVQVGFAANGGAPARNYNSTVRPVYVVNR